MSPSDSKRPGVFEDDEQRALREIERRRRVVTPAHGVPVDEFDADQPTPPPHDVNDLIRKLWPLRHAEDWLTEISEKLGGLDARTENLEKLSGGLSEIGVLRERIVDATGKSGDNGKLGELKRRVDGLTTRIWSAIGSAVASLGAAAVLIWNTSGDYHDVKAAARAANDQIKILQAQVMTLQAAAISRGSRRAGGVGATAEQPATEPGKD
ncbi:MAG: hypothetical protein AB7E70_19445 [Hyphomicrobiaceae bacterium]